MTSESASSNLGFAWVTAVIIDNCKLQHSEDDMLVQAVLEKLIVGCTGFSNT